MQDNKTNKKPLSAGGGLTGVPVCHMASKLMKYSYIAQMSLKLESTFREFKLNIFVKWILSCGIMSRKKQEESILLHNTAVAPGQAQSQFSLFTD